MIPSLNIVVIGLSLQIINVFRSDIMRFFSWCIDKFNDKFCYSIVVRDRISKLAIIDFLSSMPKLQHFVAYDNVMPEYRAAEGVYRVCYEGRYIYIELKPDVNVCVYSYTADVVQLQKYIASLIRRPAPQPKCFVTKNNEWHQPFNMVSPSVSKIHLTTEMQAVMSDVNDAVRWNSRRGYMLVGPPGSGKTLLTQMIATAHKKSIYNLDITARKMDNVVLQRLLREIPEKALVVFDEFDKQYQYIMSGQHECYVSDSGILSALDGPQRLNPGIIVIMTANTLDVFGQDFLAQLCRVGRIDRTYRLDLHDLDFATEKIENSTSSVDKSDLDIIN